MSFGGDAIQPIWVPWGDQENPVLNFARSRPHLPTQMRANEKAASSSASKDLHKGNDLPVKKEAAICVTGPHSRI